MLKALPLVSGGRKFLVSSQYLRSCYGCHGSKAVYSTTPDSSKNLTEVEEAKAPLEVPKKTWLCLESNTGTSPETGLGSETSTLTGLGSSENFSQVRLGSESTTATQTSSGSESTTATQTSSGSASDASTEFLSESHSVTELEPIETTTKLDIHERLPKKIFPKVFSFAALVNENKCLKKLIALQVDLSVVQKRKGIAKYLVACDFEKHIAPHVLFLARLDVENIGQYLTKNMDIVLIDLAELENRLNYLKSKGFESKDVSRIISNSRILLMDVESVDEKLGHLQKMFSLSGKEVREVLTKTPKLMNKPHMLQLIKENKLHCKEFLGFSHMELKTILLDYPGFFMKSPSHLSKIFDYLHNTMEIDHKTIVKNCHVFKSRLRFLQNRHLYLLKVNRAQYDPQRENFVSFNALVSGTNEEFCANVAKTSLKDYYRFQESL